MTNGNLRTKESLLPLDPIGVAQTIKQKTMKLKFLILNFSFLILTACGVTKPVATTHTERIEERVMPVAIGADTIEITEYRLQSANFTPFPAGLTLKQGENKRGNQLSTKPQKHNSPILSPCIRGTSEAEGVKIKSTRGVNISRHETDTTQTLQITLRPDTIYIPYTTHIRSDTIVVPDRICKTKLQKTQTANVLLILIIIVATIIFFLKDRKT